MNASRRQALVLSSFILLSVAAGCSDRDINGLDVARARIDPVVFDEFFDDDVYPQAFSGTDIYAITIDSVFAYNSSKSMKVTVPPRDSALGRYAGGVLTAVEARDFADFNALTLYARSSINSTLNEVGFGNDNTGNSLYTAGRANIPLAAETWTFVVVPIPSPRKLIAERGMFTYAEGVEIDPDSIPPMWDGHTLWFDEIKYAKLTNVERVSASMPTVRKQYLVGSIATIEGTTTRFNIDGAPVVVNHMSNYFDFFSSNPEVAVVEGNTIRVIGAGQDTITAKLDTLKVTGRVIITSFTPPATAAPVPTVPAADVISLYGETYPAHPVDSFNPRWGGSTTQDAIYTIAGNANLMYTTLNYVGIDFLSNPIDATQMTHVHLDVYAPVGTNFGVKLVNFPVGSTTPNGQPELTFTASTVPAFTAGAWSSLEIPMSSFVFPEGVTPDNIGQLVLVTSDARLVLVDNIYWHK